MSTKIDDFGEDKSTELDTSILKRCILSARGTLSSMEILGPLGPNTKTKLSRQYILLIN